MASVRLLERCRQFNDPWAACAKTLNPHQGLRARPRSHAEVNTSNRMEHPALPSETCSVLGFAPDAFLGDVYNLVRPALGVRLARRCQ